MMVFQVRKKMRERVNEKKKEQKETRASEWKANLLQITIDYKQMNRAQNI